MTPALHLRARTSKTRESPEASSPRQPCKGLPILRCDMTSDERAPLIEGSDNLRRGIIERASLAEDFDILAAWEEVAEKLDESINQRIGRARKNL